MSSNVPTGVKTIAVLAYIQAALATLVALILIPTGKTIVQSIINYLSPLVAINASTVWFYFYLLLLILIVIAVLSFFVGKGLWKGSKWAYVLTLIYVVLMIINIITKIGSNIVFSIIELVILLVIATYLAFSKNAKEYFGFVKKSH